LAKIAFPIEFPVRVSADRRSSHGVVRLLRSGDGTSGLGSIGAAGFDAATNENE
jgi:hypothetical protein